MLAVETERALREPADVLPAFARGAATVMNDAERRQVGSLRHLVQPDAPIEVLEVEEELRIESAGRVDCLAANEHAATRHHRHAAHRLAPRGIDDVAHVIAVESPAKPSPEELGRKAAKEDFPLRLCVNSYFLLNPGSYTNKFRFLLLIKARYLTFLFNISLYFYLN